MSTKHIHWLLAILASNELKIENCIARISKPASPDSPILLSARIPERIFDNLEDMGYIKVISNDGFKGNFVVTEVAKNYLKERKLKKQSMKKVS